MTENEYMELLDRIDVLKDELREMDQRMVDDNFIDHILYRKYTREIHIARMLRDNYELENEDDE